MRETQTLVESEIEFHPLSLLDWRGRLFETEGDIFRAIPPSCAQFYQSLLASPEISRLFETGLIRTDPTDRLVDGYSFVVKHERIDFMTFWIEWPSLMLRDAAIMVCELNLELVSCGYGTQDGHPWNVLYDFAEPRFVDFGSIVPLEEFTKQWCGEWVYLFRRCWVLPLALLAMGRRSLARNISKALDVDEPFDRLFITRYSRWFPRWYTKLQYLAHDNPREFFVQLRSQLECLRLPVQRTDWSDYYQYTGQAHHDDQQHYSVKARSVTVILNRLKPKTLIDIGGNKGWYSILAARLGAKVVTIDGDEGCMNSLYLEARSKKLKILPLLMDFTVATPAHGRKVRFPAATDRLKCEVSLMLALVHHLCFSVQVNFERISQLLADFTIKYAVVEFVPPEDKYVREMMKPGFEWYTQDNFVKAMGRYFQLVEEFDSDPPRKVLLFQKITD